MSERTSVKEYFKFILIVLGLVIFYGFNVASENESTITQPTVEVQTEVSSNIDHSSLYILDTPSIPANINSNNQNSLFIVLLISGGLLIISLLMAEVVMRLT